VLLSDAVFAHVASILGRLAGSEGPGLPLRGSRPHGGTWLRVLCLLLALAGGVLARPALADDLTDFEKARALYEKRNYAGAVNAFMAMVGTDPPRVSERLLQLESRKYLGAGLLFQGRADEARNQFRLLLMQEPTYALDPLAFPKDVVTLFLRVQAEVQAEQRHVREAEEQARAEQQRLQQQAADAERANLQRLLTLAGEAETERKNSRWIASMPFGVGQFQNGHKNLGMALAVLESVAAVASVATYLGHQQIADDRPGQEDLDETRRLESLWRKTNIASFSVFMVLAVYGIVDAHARFVPSRATARTRPLPPELRDWAKKRNLTWTGLQLKF
jgi:tetratricopeptide (TPR) repeat protein